MAGMTLFTNGNGRYGALMCLFTAGMDHKTLKVLVTSIVLSFQLLWSTNVEVQ